MKRKTTKSTTFKFGTDVPRHPKASRTKRWEALKAYRRKNPRATLEQIIAATSYTRADYRLDLARGSLK
jgi:hypothetical protein